MFGRKSKKGAENTLRDEDYVRASPYAKDFPATRKVQDPRFGEVQVCTHPTTKEQLLVQERKFHSRADAGRAILAARARIAAGSPYTVRLLDYSAEKHSQLCATLYVVKLFWEAPGQDLRRELLGRQGAGTPFTEAELLRVLYALAKANPAGAHGDINPLNVVFNRATGCVKLVERWDEPASAQRTINAQKARIAANQPLYQSPYLYGQLKRGESRFALDGAKEDAFALGLLLLELGNLRSVANIYNASRREVDLEALALHLNTFRTRNATAQRSFLCETVEALLRGDEAQRLGLHELAARLPAEAEFRSRYLLGGAAPMVTQTVSARTLIAQQQVLDASVAVTSVHVSPALTPRASLTTTTVVRHGSRTHLPAALGVSQVGEIRPVAHEFRTGGSVIAPRVIHNYHGPDINLHQPRPYASPALSGSLYASPREVYVSSAPGPVHASHFAAQNVYAGAPVVRGAEPVRAVYDARPAAAGLMSASYLNHAGSIERCQAYTGEAGASLARAGSCRLVRSYHDSTFATDVRNY